LEESFNAHPRHSTSGELKSFITAKLMQEDQPFGLLVAASRSDKHFESRWEQFVCELALAASEFLSRVKKSVERQQSLTSAIVENTLDGLAVVDLDSGEVLLNPVARSLLEVPLGESCKLELVQKRLNIEIEDIWRELGETSIERPKRTIIRHTDLDWREEQIFLRLNASLFPSSSAENRRKLLVVLHDVTQERSVEEVKARLIANISHELRTPTAVLKEFISLILDGVAGEPTDNLKQFVIIMQSNVERLSRLIENLLTLARSDTGGFSIVLRPIDMAPLIESVAQSLIVKLKQKGMKLTVSLPENLPLVFADKEAVTQILINLIENARKYSPDDTEVTLTAVVKSSRIEFAVADQGYGIPPGERETIFKRFHRLVDKNDPKFQEGVGLGLSLVKELVMRHGGDIWVESEVGKGSTFYFSLQIAQEDDESKPV
jgi:two-component system phosphate regulon sensor histidine kinase PhoR